jgi:uncharacterized protein
MRINSNKCYTHGNGRDCMRILLISLALIIYSGITFYIGYNIRALMASFQITPKPILFWGILYVVAFAFVIARFHESLGFLAVIGNYWMFVIQYGLLLCIISNILIKFTPLSTKVVGTGALSIFVILFVMGTYYAYTPVVHQQTIKIDKQGEPMRVVVGSDFHLGILSNKRHLQNFVTRSNEQNPDLVLLVGDIIDDDPGQYIKQNMMDVMDDLTATYGVYGVLGNHEYYGKKIEAFNEAMKQSNVTILMDETVELPNGVYLTGREDITNQQRQPLSALAPEQVNKPWLVMNHTPNDLSEPQKENVDFHVSGHTHRGQLWPNQYITKRTFDLDYGYQMWGDLHALVTSGYGFWGPPMRIGTQAELWVIDIEYTK